MSDDVESPDEAETEPRPITTTRGHESKIRTRRPGTTSCSWSTDATCAPPPGASS